MKNNAVDDLGNWWIAEKASSKDLDVSKANNAALRELGVLFLDEVIVSERILADWHQDSEDTYNSVFALDIENQERIRSVIISAYAIVTPPGISINDRLIIWQERADMLARGGVLIPKWLLTWRGTIYINLPPHKLSDYVKEHQMTDNEIGELAVNLKQLFINLSTLSLNPLGLFHHLRTDSFSVYYCGMGFDVGEPDENKNVNKLSQYEQQVLPYLPDRFQKKYYEIKS